MSEPAQDQAASPATSPNPVNELATKYWQYILDNPIKSATTAILSWGGLLLLVFFLHISFMPDVNLESVSSLLYAVALFGGVIAAFSAVVMVLPGLALVELRSHAKFVRTRHLFSIAIGASSTWAAAIICTFYEISMRVTWAVLVIAPLVVVLIDALIDTNRLFQISRPPSKSQRTITRRSRTPFKDLAQSIKKLSRKKRTTNDQRKPFLRLFWLRLWGWRNTYAWIFIMVSIVSLLLVLPVLFVGVIGLTGDIRTASVPQATWLFVVLVLMIALSAAVIGSARSTAALTLAVAFAPMLLYLVLLVTGSFSAFSLITVQALGQGEISAARITVSSKTCKEINQALGQRVCADAGDEEVTAICPVMVRSRIGSQALLEFAPMVIQTDKSGIQHARWLTFTQTTSDTRGNKRDQKLIRRVVLEKSKMLAWQPLQDLKEGQREPSSDATQLPLASFIARSKQADNVSTDTNEDTLIRMLRNRCGEDLSAQHSVSVSNALDNAPKESPDRSGY